jgi:hypothetical protein
MTNPAALGRGLGASPPFGGVKRITIVARVIVATGDVRIASPRGSAGSVGIDLPALRDADDGPAPIVPAGVAFGVAGDACGVGAGVGFATGAGREAGGDAEDGLDFSAPNATICTGGELPLLVELTTVAPCGAR